MSLSAENMQSAKCDHFLLVLFAFGPDLFIDGELALLRQVLFPIEHLLEHEFGVAAEQNVGAATGHVRGDGHRTLASSLSHNFRFAFVLLGVEYVVLDAITTQHAGGS